MWEDVFQIYRRFGDSDADLIASDLSLSDATMFIEAWMLKSYAVFQNFSQVKVFHSFHKVFHRFLWVKISTSHYLL